jgi:hypothetical protein
MARTPTQDDTQNVEANTELIEPGRELDEAPIPCFLEGVSQELLSWSEVRTVHHDATWINDQTNASRSLPALISWHFVPDLVIHLLNRNRTLHYIYYISTHSPHVDRQIQLSRLFQQLHIRWFLFQRWDALGTRHIFLQVSMVL